MKGNISKQSVDSLSPGEILFDKRLRGFAARCLASGRISYSLKYTEPTGGRQRWFALGLHGEITAGEARQRAERARGRISAGADPQGEREAALRARGSVCTLNDLLDEHLRLYVHRRGLRSEAEIARCFDKYVRPALGMMPIAELRRGHIVTLLDTVATENGPVMADRVLAHLRKALNWHATRDENFTVPLVRGMSQPRVRQRARDRILTDPELRALWRATDGATGGTFGVVVRLLMLTAQRREEVAGMCWAEVNGTVWTIPGARAKNGRPNAVPLSAAAHALLRSVPNLGKFVFGRDGDAPYSGFSKSKAALDRCMATALRRFSPAADWQSWTIHDLRRTARSLMARAGVASDVAERVLNHAIPGVRGVYDRHDYIEEKRQALDVLAALIERIINPETNVVELSTRRT